MRTLLLFALAATFLSGHGLSAAEVAAPAPMAAAAAAEPGQVREAVRVKRKRWTFRANALAGDYAARVRRLGVMPRKAGHETGLAAHADHAAAGPTRVPATIDWRSVGGQSYVTPVRDQGGCGSCWAFSTTGALESYVMRSRGTPGSPVDLSEQQIVSCSNGGSCAGGWPDRASQHIREDGLVSEAAFPYKGVDAPCRVAQPNPKRHRRIGRWEHVRHDVEAMKTALAEHGPLPTTMAVYTDFFYYGGGVYSYSTGTLAGYHAILIVGYSDAERAFIVKNSWGEGWGEKGYFKIDYDAVKPPVIFGYDTLAYSTAAVSPVRIAIRGLGEGDVVRGKVHAAVAARARGDTVITDLWAKLDRGQFKRVSTDGAYDLMLDGRLLPDGPHALAFRAFDNAGNRREVEVRFRVMSRTQPFGEPRVADRGAGFQRVVAF